MKILSIRKWGNSQGILLPKHILELIRLDVGDQVECEVKEGCLILRPKTKKVRPKFTLEEVLAKIPENFEQKEVDWGESVGEEV